MLKTISFGLKTILKNFIINTVLTKLTYFRIPVFLILILLINIDCLYSQFDSSKIIIGPEDLNAVKGGNYFNFADKNKVNIEITLIGGNGSGRYLIPQGTTVFDILLMSGGAGRRNLGGIKLLRFASDTPKLKPNEVIELDFSTLYSEDVKEIKSSSLNPVLKAGDMVIVPRPASEPQSFWVYLTTIMSYATTLISFYYVITNVFRYNRP